MATVSAGDYDGTEDYNERCMRDERDSARARREAVAAYNRRTAKLAPNGSAARARVIAARINLHSDEER